MYCASSLFLNHPFSRHCVASADMFCKRRKQQRCAPGVIKEMREEGHEPEASTLATLAVAAVQDSPWIAASLPEASRKLMETHGGKGHQKHFGAVDRDDF